MGEMSYREALHDGLYDILESDPKTFLLGEDVGRYGGTYAVSKGLLEKFGEDRIKDTPLSESSFTGLGIGAAMGGMHPIVEIMTCNFALLALDQIVNNAATIRHMSGGQVEVPITIRMATGAGRQLAAQHSHSWEGWFSHIPGLKIITPATITDARYMLQAAVKDPNPVILFEQAALYNNTGELKEVSEVDIAKASVLKEGSDISLISYGAGIHKCMNVARELDKRGVSAEVVDLRVLRPLDNATIMQSVVKTHRAVIVDEGWRSGSLSAEIITRIQEEVFYELDAPVMRVCTEEIPIPYSASLEQQCIPNEERILAKVKECLHGGY
ncbi:alpha-ketoacid dehydrogenase subunit beta [Halobacteriovorax sp. GFR7]|uniref:alpha-ketoacid dehydrogenase subunit beta n=1 Tax=unclassified Halobacteriovorax TaxID=2639665 RepID=UPI003D963AA9